MFDVLIVGAGMVGASLACALGDKQNQTNRNLKVGLIEARPDLLAGQFGADGRASAIALGSAKIWQSIGVWEGMKQRGVTPMHTIQVSDGDYPHVVQLRREDISEEALGYVVPNAVTQASLWEFVQDCANIEIICPARILDIRESSDGSNMEVKIASELGEQFLSTKLLVAADGGKSLVRSLASIPIAEKHYEQTCIVVTVKTEYPHSNVAYERFQSSGPFAILPLQNTTSNRIADRCCIVWTATAEEAPKLMAMPEEQFLAELSRKFGNQLGEITLESRTRASYVPRWMHAETYFLPRLVLVGDAAHTTHPVAGQGMNLGIRDIGALAEILVDAHRKGEDIGSATVLKRYERRRRWDNLAVILFTDLTNRLFSNQFFLWQWIRRLGLAIANFLPLKRILMYAMMGLLNRPPQLHREELTSK